MLHRPPGEIKVILIELLSETSDERSETRNRCNTLEIHKNELHNSLQLLFSSELGVFEADLRENWEISKDFLMFYIRKIQGFSRIFQILGVFDFKCAYLGAEEEL